jgi:protein involved in polysaccharide export with SLBB domain
MCNSTTELKPGDVIEIDVFEDGNCEFYVYLYTKDSLNYLVDLESHQFVNGSLRNYTWRKIT